MPRGVESTGDVRYMTRSFMQLENEKSLETKLEKLILAMSYKTLHLIPDYRQKAGILQQLV